MTDSAPWTETAMLEAAARAIGKIDARGLVGLSRITYAEIEAMALTLVSLGVRPIPPGDDRPDHSSYASVRKGADQ